MLAEEFVEDDDLHDYYAEDEEYDPIDLPLEDITCYKLSVNGVAENTDLGSHIIILDTAAGESLFRDSELVTYIIETRDIVRFDGVNSGGDPIITNTEGTSAFGNVMLSKQSMGNILSFGNVVDDCYRVIYDSESDTFVVQPRADQDDVYYFQRDVNAENIYICDLSCHPVSRCAMVMTVSDNLSKYTKREVKSAELARQYIRRTDYMSAGKLIKTIKTGKIRNCKVSVQDVLRSIDIWGKDLGNLKGKSTAHKVRENRSTALERLEVAEKQDMHIDLLYFNEQGYMLALFQPLDLAVAIKLQGYSAPHQLHALERLMKIVTSGGVKIWRIRCDEESAIHSDLVKRKLPDGITLDPTAGASAVADVERKIRTLKERIRAVINTLPYRLCIQLEDWLLQSCLYYISFEPTVNAIDNRSPREQLLGVILDADTDLRYAYGDYCQVSSDDTDNSMTERTQAAIALMPVGNSTGAWWFFLIKTGKAVRRNHATALPMPDDIIDILNDMADKDERKKQLPVGECVQLARGYAHNFISDEPQPDQEREQAEQAAGNEQLPAQIVPVYQEQPDLNPVDDYLYHAADDHDEEYELFADDFLAEEIAPVHYPKPSEEERDALLRDIFGEDSDDAADVLHEPDATPENQPDAVVVEQHDDAEVAAQTADPQPAEARYNLRERKIPAGSWRGAAAAKVRGAGRKHRRTTTPAAGVNRQQQQEHVVKLSYFAAGSVPKAQHVFKVDPNEQFLKCRFAFNMTIKQGIDKLGDEAVLSVVKEMLQLHEKDAWRGVHIDKLTPEEAKLIITSRTFLKDKYTAQGVFDKLKARLVAGGHLQDREIYDNGSSPTVSTQSAFMIAAIAAAEGRAVATIDVEGAFINSFIPDSSPPILVRLGKYETEVLCHIDPSYKEFVLSNGTMVVKLNRALYGCVESAKIWYDTLSRDLEALGFKRNPMDMCVFNRSEDGGKQTTICVHVDDMKITAPSEHTIDQLIADLGKKYPKLTIKRGQVLDYLGMTFDYTQAGKVKVTMSGYIKELMMFCEDIEGETSTPAASDLFTVKKNAKALDKEGREYFHSVTAKLLYLGKRVRPDILTAVSFLSKRVQSPTDDDMRKLCRVIRYIRGTKDKGICLEADKYLSILAYVDASYGVHEDFKSHTGSVIGIGKGPIYAKSSGQKLNTKSSAEAELVGLSDSVGQVIWTRNFLLEQGYQVAPATVYQDNQAAIALVKNGKSNSHRTRHIAIRYFFIKDRVDSKEIRIEYMRTGDMLADILTKPLQGDLFRRLRDMLLNWYD